jgi:capsular exopolysaccharide synthesis family protein
MDLQHYFTVFWRRKWVILLVTATVLLVTAAGQSRITPLYTSTATIRLALSLSLTQNSQIYNYNTQLMNTFVALSTSRAILMELTDRLQVRPLPTIEVTVVPNTELVRISTTDPDPEIAQLTSNTLAQLLIEKSGQLFAGSDLLPSAFLLEQLKAARIELNKAQGQYATVAAITPTATGQPSTVTLQLITTNALVQEKQRTYENLLREYEEAQLQEALTQDIVILVEEAPLPRNPSQPSASLNSIIALLAGLFAGVLLAFVFENTDSRLFTARDIQSLVPHIPVLANLPHAARKNLIVSRNKTSAYAEAVRMLAARIQLGERRHKQNVLALAGADSRQGASRVVANLGIALAEQGRKVVIVDSNGRNPSMHKIFELANEKGFFDILSGDVDMVDAIQDTAQEKLSVIVFGSGSLGPVHMREPSGGALIKFLRQKFDYILFDAPALNVADIIGMAPYADELMMVARCSHIKHDSLRSAGEFISRFTDKRLELIINEADTRSSS